MSRKHRSILRFRVPGLAVSGLLLVAAATAAPNALRAQQTERDSIPSDVRVGITYQPAFRPGIVVPPFRAPPELTELADSVRTLIRRDLDYSDRLEVMSVGEDVPLTGPTNYEMWNEMGAVWLLVGTVEGPMSAAAVRLSLHDVVFRVLQDVRAFDLRPREDPAFRMVIHSAADQVVGWATGSPGSAATRIAYVARAPGGSEIYLVDSDGFGARPLTADSSIALSPAWSPDGERVAYMSYRDGEPAIHELDLRRGRSRVRVDLPGLDMTPAYSPDGSRLAFAATIEGRTEIHIDDEGEGGPQRITWARFANSLSPTFAPEGARIAFNSDRLGQLHVFVMSLDGGSPELVTPYIYDRSVHNAGPDWSPTGDRIAFHGWVDGRPQIFTVAPDGGGLRQLTQEGRNEDPSWAPDGRHIVFASTRGGGPALWILDTVTGRIRRLVAGNAVRLPAWSGRLDSQLQFTNGTAAGTDGQQP